MYFQNNTIFATNYKSSLHNKELAEKSLAL